MRKEGIFSLSDERDSVKINKNKSIYTTGGVVKSILTDTKARPGLQWETMAILLDLGKVKGVVSEKLLVAF